ncbi:MAG: ParB/RepB/Spo0J family partition protein [Oscillospiraceae bacterium]|nr:ParB/RepB/Spo0J family partition protein [Oscillospiraceae bacterium]
MALGKGFDDLFGDNNTVAEGETITTLRLTEIEPNKDQPRSEFDQEKLTELADSIRANGVIQPIIVRPLANGLTYQIVAGERRWRAARIAGLTEIPVIIREVDDLQVSRIALIENIQREDLDPIEEAKAYRKLIEQYGMKHEELSKSVGKSRPYITNSLRLLTMPEFVTDLISSGDISVGHAKVLLGLVDKDDYGEALDKIQSGHLNVRQTEKLVEKLNSDDGTETIVPENKFYIETAMSLKEQTGRNVNIKSKGKEGRGQLTIDFYNDDDLKYIVNLLAGGFDV